MAHTPFFHQVRKAVVSASREVQAPDLETNFGSACEISRRSALKLGTGLLATLAGCASLREAISLPLQSQPDVKIVGGGMAGLHCAYQLQLAGVRSEIFEAAGRVGGRMFTARGKFPDGQNVELGGEFIDSGHENIHLLAKLLEIPIDDLEKPEAKRLPPINYFGGRPIAEQTFIELSRPLVAHIKTALERGRANPEELKRLDRMSILEWLDTLPDLDPLVRKALDTSYTIEFGLDAGKQSALNLLYMMEPTGDSAPNFMGESDMRFRVRSGNDTLTTRLAAELPKDNIHLNARLLRVAEAGSGYELTFQGPGPTFTERCDVLVLALPFSVLRHVELKVPLDAEKRWVIDHLGYGTNAKVMGAFEGRFWQAVPNSGRVTSDNGLQTTWDASQGQSGQAGVLTNFLGGTEGAQSNQGSAEERFRRSLELLDPILPGAKGLYATGTAQRMHWPSNPEAQGSYACYEPGQWSHQGQEGRPVGKIYFCGEHCAPNPNNQGFMEGAVQSGAQTAKDILEGILLHERAQRVPVLGKA